MLQIPGIQLASESFRYRGIGHTDGVTEPDQGVSGVEGDDFYHLEFKFTIETQSSQRSILKEPF